MSRPFYALLVAVLAVFTVKLDDAGAQAPAPFAAGEVLVKFHPGAAAGAIADAHRRNGAQEQAVIPGVDIRRVRVPAGREAAAIAAYTRNPNVLFAEVNGLYQAIGAPNDPRIGEQWQYNNTNDADIDAFEAWDVTTGGASVAIAILDTGINQTHADLSAKVTRSIDFTRSSSGANDLHGHGTHVAGSAAALTNNATGVSGTCPNCVLYNVKVLGDTGSGTWEGIANGITWAADNGAKVINLSLGGASGSSTLEAAVNYAWNKGVLVTAAAGNSNTSSPFFPAAYPNVIAVAATDRNDARASFSNYGSWVDVAAPGANILSTTRDGVYGTMSGTSMASPHVAGVAGLVWSTGICGDNACVRQQIEEKADPISGTGTYWAKGRINAYNSVRGSQSGAPSPVGDLNGALRGVGSGRFLKAGTTLDYTIRFENLPTATAPAKTVVITHQLDADLDLATFALHTLSFGNIVVDAGGSSTLSTIVDVTERPGLQVQITASLDPATRVVTWRLASLNPATGRPAADAPAGFLRPNLRAPEGAGFVTFSVKPSSAAAAGTRIDAQAHIVFDTNHPTVTPAIFNTIDAGPPSSAVGALPSTTTAPAFSVSWSGTDGAGSGIGVFDVFVSVDGGAFTPWLAGTTQSSATFSGVAGHRYAFYSVATDQVGYREAVPSSPDVTTEVVTTGAPTETLAPSPTPSPIPAPPAETPVVTPAPLPAPPATEAPAEDSTQWRVFLPMVVH